MMHRKNFKVLFCGALAAASLALNFTFAEENGTAWRQNWTLNGFKSPESAAFSTERRAIFVSNVNGYEKNGAGFISRLSMDGVVEDLVWLEGLNAPTGLAVSGDILWAVDYDRLLSIHIPSRLILFAYESDDRSPLLNDVALDDDGSVFVTGSGSNSIYKLEKGRLKTWLKNDEALQYANGIDVTPDHLIVAGVTLMRIGRSDKQIEIISDDKALHDLEGVKSDGAGGFYVSAVGDRPLYHVDAGGNVTEELRGREFIADFDIADEMLAAPVSAGAVSGFQRSKNP
ncbi:SMP-30/gluconolactonase/LRE family protein [Hyphococcus sp.]|jgi:hypothetical protein|uniref:SMP-30/gluconolactonase/LRE family protein n=1 Tax=Hyphococcus sp. TaxID=2038636 RepID=UPI003D104B41